MKKRKPPVSIRKMLYRAAKQYNDRLMRMGIQFIGYMSQEEINDYVASSLKIWNLVQSLEKPLQKRAFDHEDSNRSNNTTSDPKREDS